MITTLLLAAVACATVPAEPQEEEEADTITAEEVREELEAVSDPKVQESQLDAIDLIEHLHGKAEVEAYKEKLLEEKAKEVAAQLEAQLEAEKAAKAEAVAKAEQEAKQLEDQIIETEKKKKTEAK